MIIPPIILVLANLAPLLLEFDEDQLKAWNRYSTSFHDNPAPKDLLGRMRKLYGKHTDVSLESVDYSDWTDYYANMERWEEEAKRRAEQGTASALKLWNSTICDKKPKVDE